MENKKSFLNIYGVSISLSGCADTVNKLTSDFKYFTHEQTKQNDLNVNIQYSIPPYEKIPEVKASMYKTDCICYDDKNIRYADYNGQCLVIFDRIKKSAEIFSLSYDMLYEISYLFIHSQAGELLDLKGIHRIHACSFSFENNVYICMLPQGGGKSTLLMNLLKNDDIKLLSDDTPLLDRQGNILPFPIRIGLCADFNTEYIPENFITIFNRRKFGQKKLIAYDFFKDKIEKRILMVRIICAERFFSDKQKLTQKNKIYAFTQLLKNCVIGYGLPQVLEYFLAGGLKDIIKKTYIAVSRLYACIILLFKTSSVYYFYIGKNNQNNAEYFLKIFHK